MIMRRDQRLKYPLTRTTACGSTIRMTDCRGNRSFASTDRMINGSWPIFRTLPADSSSLSPPDHFLALGTVGLARDDGGGNWYQSEQSCFVIARGPAEPRSI